jgi:dihydroflavonol-4-reductase
MTQIDKTKPVLVTGATGYVAGWLVKKLLDEGLTVHAGVRKLEAKRVAHLDAIVAQAPGSIKYFETDLLQRGSYAEAMEDCDLVFHTASPFTSAYTDAQRDLIDPAVKGTANVLHQAVKTGSVKRVVLTSSCAAIYNDAVDLARTPHGVFTEEVWNTTASLNNQPYSYSKTLAEIEAWKIAEAQEQWDLVVINPSLVMGPALNPQNATSESMRLLKQLGDGTMKMGVPNMGIGLVDVRDVALAHYQAGFTPEANGRHITSGHNTGFLEIAQLLHKHFGGQYPVPNKALPKWLLMLIGPMVNKSLTRNFIRNNIDQIWKADNTKVQRELGVTFRPLEETMIDSFKMLIDEKIITPKKKS